MFSGGNFRHDDTSESIILVPKESYKIEDAVGMIYAEGLGYDFIMAPIEAETGA